MEMKPEYSYGYIESYDVTLYGDKCGKNKKQLADIFEKSCGFKGQTQNWQKLIGKHKTIMSWHKLSEAELQDLTYELAEVNAVPEVYQNHWYISLRNDVFLADTNRNRLDSRIPVSQHERIRESQAQSLNGWYSGALTVAHEYSFELWARANDLDEAYRFTIIPAFHNVSVIRLWRKGDELQLVDKIGGTTYFRNYNLQKTEQRILKLGEWNTLKAFMDENFWTASSWFGRSVHDGDIYLFEGWRDGQYKLLQDDTPTDENLPSLRAMRLFSSLL